MKISSKALIILSSIIIVVALVVLYILYSQEIKAQQTLDSQVAAAQANLSSLVGDRSQLEEEREQKAEELVQAILALDEADLDFPEAVESIEYDEVLFGFARSFDLEVVRLQAFEERVVAIEDIDYLASSFTVEVRGGVGSILSFIATIVESEYFSTTSIDEVDIITTEVEVEEGEEGEVVECSAGTIQLTVYRYEGGHSDGE